MKIEDRAVKAAGFVKSLADAGRVAVYAPRLTRESLAVLDKCPHDLTAEGRTKEILENFSLWGLVVRDAHFWQRTEIGGAVLEAWKRAGF